MAVNKRACLICSLLLAFSVNGAWATGWRKAGSEVIQVNHRIKGKIIDHTANHGADHRIWSKALDQRRDLYVYLPPCFDPNQRYPLIILFHGFAQDEQVLLELAPVLDKAIVDGQLPPAIIAAPDGSLSGEPYLMSPGSFFINTQAGDFEDFVLQDVWDFVVTHYPIRPEREAHVLAGVSMGGFAAFNLGIRHRDGFGVVIGLYPPVNLRWVGKDGNYMANFNPYNWGWRTHIDRRDPVARFLGGLITLRMKHIVDPLFSSPEEALDEITQNNPIELVHRTGLQNGELEMYIAYGGKDQFNIDAQVESFLYLCKFRGLCIGVGYTPHGKHDMATAVKLLPGIVEWLAPRLAPYSPPMVCGPCPAGGCPADAGRDAPSCGDSCPMGSAPVHGAPPPVTTLPGSSRTLPSSLPH
jgi:S-formylglutathione hydrolase FrmB